MRQGFTIISFLGWRGVGRAKVGYNENDLNDEMISSCLQVYRNEIKRRLSIAKQ